MLDVVPPGPNAGRIDPKRRGEIGPRFSNLERVDRAVLDERQTGTIPQNVEDLVQQVRLCVPADRDVIDILDVRTDGRQAVLNGLPRKPRPVLDTLEAFLLHCGCEHAVDENRRGGVAVVGVDSKDDHDRSVIGVRAPGPALRNTGTRSLTGSQRSGFIGSYRVPL